MVTRRAMLKGTAAGSIAAIASAHSVAASAAPAGPIPIPYPNSVGAGYGNLEGGALAGFIKLRNAYNMFIKWHHTGAEVFYEEDPVNQAVNVFFKFFDKPKGWGAFIKLDSIEGLTLQGADAGFLKVQADSARFFLKIGGEVVDARDVFAEVAMCQPNTVGCEGTIG